MKNITLIIIFILAFILRIYGLDWDQSHHLHPDERFLTMVTSAVKIPPSLANYFSQKESTLNPYNHNFTFYVYGTFPLLITRFFGELFKQTGYDEIFLIGRQLSVFFDLLTLFLVYKISSLVFKNKTISLWTMFFYAIAVFPIQQAHFFTVDSFTVFFSTLTLFLLLFFLEKKKWLIIFLTGISFGLTLANKTSIGITLPVFILTIVFSQKISKKDLKTISKEQPRQAFNLLKLINDKRPLVIYTTNLILFILGLIISFRIFQPYAFSSLFHLYPHWLNNISEAHKMITGEIDYPPNIAWSYTKPFIHPFINIFFWGFGPITSVLSILGILFSVLKRERLEIKRILILFSFSGIIFIYQGIQLAKYMRYFYPLYPILVVFSGFFAYYLTNFIAKNDKKKKLIFISLLIIISLIWPISFLSIYSRLHSRVLASKWIYDNIPAGSKITSEEWDDGLPLGIPGCSTNYINIPLAPYNPETLEKWQKITDQLKEADYIIMSSNRLFDSIPKLPQRYPVTTLYYQLLFKEKLGFKKVAKITSHPCFLPIGKPLFCLNDDSSEESFTVYDHPKIIIFKKENFSEKLLLPLLNEEIIKKAKYLNPKETNYLFKIK